MSWMHISALFAFAFLFLQGSDPPVSAAQSEKLPAPKEVVEKTPKEAKPPVKASRDEPEKGLQKDEAKPSDITILQARKSARDSMKATVEDAKKVSDAGITDAKIKGDTAWMLTASALVMLMVPGLALFYGGMVRKKNVLATMMQSYAALSVVGLYWVAVGYGLAFGPSVIKIDLLGVSGGGLLGWSSDLFFLRAINADTLLAGSNITVFAHVMFQGMFAIITPALISGAIAERIRFWPFCIFMLLWVTFVYCPLAHMVWAFDWFYTVPLDADKGIGGSAIGLLGKLGALDFAGGTVVHIAAGTAGLATALVLRRRVGYPEHTIQPNSMVLTLIGAGLLWFGWFGFNGGSATASSALATSAFAATQAAAAAAGLSWMLVEWLVKGKPTALGLASGIVAGLVAVTPASGFVYIWGGAVIGFIAGIVCYFAVSLKTIFRYDDSLDAFGVHAVGGFLGAVLTGIFCYAAVNSAGADGYFAMKGQKTKLEELRAQFSDASTLFQLDDLSKKSSDLKADIDKAGIDAENARIDIETARGDAASASSDLEKARAGKKEADSSAGDAFKKAAAEQDRASKALKDAEDKQRQLEDDLKKTEAETARLQQSHKKSKSTLRLEALETLIKDKDDAVETAKKEKKEADDNYDAAAEAARKASERTKALETVSTRKEFEKAKEVKEKKTQEYQKIAAESNELKAEQKKLVDGKTDLKKLENARTELWAKEKGTLSQFGIQFKAALFSAVFAFVFSLLLALLTQAITFGSFTTDKKKENEGLDLTEHGELGFDLSVGYDSIPTHAGAEPKSAKAPPGQKRFEVVIDGIENGNLIKAWSELCVPSEEPIDVDFKAVYPFVTTVQGNRFRLRGGDPASLSSHIQKLFSRKLGKQIKVHVEE